jgi:hypothetical protein
MGMNAARLSRSFDGVPRQITSGREMAAILELKAVLQRFFDWGRNIFPSCGVIEPRLNAPQLNGRHTSPAYESGGELADCHVARETGPSQGFRR